MLSYLVNYSQTRLFYLSAALYNKIKFQSKKKIVDLANPNPPVQRKNPTSAENFQIRKKSFQIQTSQKTQNSTQEQDQTNHSIQQINSSSVLAKEKQPLPEYIWLSKEEIQQRQLSSLLLKSTNLHQLLLIYRQKKKLFEPIHMSILFSQLITLDKQKKRLNQTFKQGEDQIPTFQNDQYAEIFQQTLLQLENMNPDSLLRVLQTIANRKSFISLYLQLILNKIVNLHDENQNYQLLSLEQKTKLLYLFCKIKNEENSAEKVQKIIKSLVNFFKLQVSNLQRKQLLQVVKSLTRLGQGFPQDSKFNENLVAFLIKRRKILKSKDYLILLRFVDRIFQDNNDRNKELKAKLIHRFLLLFTEELLAQIPYNLTQLKQILEYLSFISLSHLEQEVFKEKAKKFLQMINKIITFDPKLVLPSSLGNAFMLLEKDNSLEQFLDLNLLQKKLSDDCSVKNSVNLITYLYSTLQKDKSPEVKQQKYFVWIQSLFFMINDNFKQVQGGYAILLLESHNNLKKFLQDEIFLRKTLAKTSRQLYQFSNQELKQIGQLIRQMQMNSETLNCLKINYIKPLETNIIIRNIDLVLNKLEKHQESQFKFKYSVMQLFIKFANQFCLQQCVLDYEQLKTYRELVVEIEKDSNLKQEIQSVNTLESQNKAMSYQKYVGIMKKQTNLINFLVLMIEIDLNHKEDLHKISLLEQQLAREAQLDSLRKVKEIKRKLISKTVDFSTIYRNTYSIMEQFCVPQLLTFDNIDKLAQIEFYLSRNIFPEQLSLSPKLKEPIIKRQQILSQNFSIRRKALRNFIVSLLKEVLGSRLVEESFQIGWIQNDYLFCDISFLLKENNAKVGVILIDQAERIELTQVEKYMLKEYNFNYILNVVRSSEMETLKGILLKQIKNLIPVTEMID